MQPALARLDQQLDGPSGSALLVLSAMAGLSDEMIDDLRVADIIIADGENIIRTSSGTTTLASNSDDLICAMRPGALVACVWTWPCCTHLDGYWRRSSPALRR